MSDLGLYLEVGAMSLVVLFVVVLTAPSTRLSTQRRKDAKTQRMQTIKKLWRRT